MFMLQLATAMTSGELPTALAGLSPAARGPVTLAARSAFTTSLNHILLVAAIALLTGLLSLLLIRTRDFVRCPSPEAGPGQAAAGRRAQ